MSNYYALSCSFWADPDFEECSPLATLLYIYLGSNPNCNLIGFYQITIKRMYQDTRMTKNQVVAALNELENMGKISWDGATNWVCIKGRLSRIKNRDLDPYFKGIIKEILTLPDLPITKSFLLRHNQFLSTHPVGKKYTEVDKERLLAFLTKFLCDTNDIGMSSQSHTNASITLPYLDLNNKDQLNVEEEDSIAKTEPDEYAELLERIQKASGVPFPRECLNHPFLQDGGFVDSWIAFLEMRRKIRAPPTEKATEMLLAKLQRYPLAESIEMLDKSTVSNWRDVFPPKEKQNGANQKSYPKRESVHEYNERVERERIQRREAEISGGRDYQDVSVVQSTPARGGNPDGNG